MKGIHNKGRTLLAISVAAMVSLAAWAADGGFDNSFGPTGNGHTRVDLTGSSTVAGADRDALDSIAVVGNGLIAAGTADFDGNDEANGALFIARFDAVGSLTGSTVVNPGPRSFFGSGFETSTSVTPDGKVLVTGDNHDANDETGATFQGFVRRYSSTGTLEAEFLRPLLATDRSSCSFATLDNAGRVIAICVTQFNGSNGSQTATLIRLNNDASLSRDTSFGSLGNGEVRIPQRPSGFDNGDPLKLTQDSAGNYIVLNSTQDEDADRESVYLTKVSSSGAVDMSFGGGSGFVQLTIPAQSTVRGLQAATVATDASNRIYVGGSDFHDQSESTPSQTYVARLSTNGVLDTSFDGDGYFVRNANQGIFGAVRGLIPQADGKVVALISFNGAIRINANGSLDTGFTSPSLFSFTDGRDNRAEFKGLTAVDNGNRAIAVGGIQGFCVDNPSSCGNNPNPVLTEAFLGKIILITDITPDVFTFVDQANVATNTAITSNVITVAGLDPNANAPLSISGAQTSQYSLGCTSGFTNQPTTVNNGQTLCVRHTSSSSNSTATNTVLTIGSVSDTFTSTTSALDTTPDDFQFPARINQPRGQNIVSNTVTITGINGAAPVSVSGGAYSIGCGTTFITSAGQINNGETVCVQVASSGNPQTTTTVSLNVGGVTRGFSVTTVSADTTPDAFSFAPVTDADTNVLVSSNSITVTGIDSGETTPISVSNGSYNINGGPFTSNSATVRLNDVVRAQVRTANTINTTTTATVVIGGVSAAFSATTNNNDTAPDGFVFTDRVDVAPASVITSNAITVSGINIATPISVTGGEYRIGSGGFTAAAGSVNNGDSVQVRHTSSAASSSRVDTTLNIGGVSDTFSSTTLADTSPDAFTFAPRNAVERSTVITSETIIITGIDGPAPISVTGGSYSISCAPNGFTTQAGTISSSQTVCVRHTSSANFGTAVNTALTVGDQSATFTSTTAAQDTTPTAYSFASISNTARSAAITSAPITVAGINDATQINVQNGSYSINNGAFLTAPGMVVQGDTVRVQHTSSASDSTNTVSTLSIGGVAATFTSTTGDGTPNAFAFAAQNAVSRNTQRTSAAATVTGLTIATPISVTGGSYSIDGGAFTTQAGSISNNQTVSLRHTSSSAFETKIDTVLTIGGVAGTFSSTTEAQDTTPDAFGFAAQSNTAKAVAITSAAATISGINDATAISVTGGSYSLDGGPFTTQAATINAGQSVRVQHTSSAADTTPTSTTLTIGAVTGSFTSTTGDGTPTAFSFAAQSNVARGALVTSAPATINGLTIATPVSVSNGSYSINNGPFTSSAGTISNGDAVRVQHTAASAPLTAVTSTLSIGGVSGSFTSTSAQTDTVPNAFSFVDQTNVVPGSVVTSAAVTVFGIDAPTAVSVTGGSYSINGAAFTGAQGMVANGDSLRVQHTAATAASTPTNTVLTVGSISDTFTSTTGDATPDAFSFASQRGVARGATITSEAVTLSGITLPVAISVAGGTYSLNGAAFTSTAGTASNGDVLRLQHTAANGFEGETTTTVTVGGVSAGFVSTTLSGLTTTASTGQSVTLTTSQGRLTVLSPTAVPVAAPADLNYPVGFFNYTVTGLPTTGTPATVTLVFTLPAGVAVDRYVKCLASGCSTLSGASVNGNLLTLSVTDNGPADSNPAQGVIDDPGAPAIAKVVSVPVNVSVSGGALGGSSLLLLLPALLGLRRRRIAA